MGFLCCDDEGGGAYIDGLLLEDENVEKGSIVDVAPEFIVIDGLGLL